MKINVYMQARDTFYMDAHFFSLSPISYFFRADVTLSQPCYRTNLGGALCNVTPPPLKKKKYKFKHFCPIILWHSHDRSQLIILHFKRMEYCVIIENSYISVRQT